MFLRNGLKSFLGGVHPADGKSLASGSPVEVLPPPAELVVPMAQHIGKPAKAVVKKGDVVKKGQLIGEASGPVSAAVHAPVSGSVTKVDRIPGIFGRHVEAVFLANDGKEEWHESVHADCPDAAVTPEEARKRIAGAGLVGMGGATFPTSVKLSPPKGKNIEILVINGVECEPYLTSDYRLMIERPDDILKGAEILKAAVGAKRVIIAVEANKPDAFSLLKGKISGREGLEAEMLAVRYPQGGERQLINALTGREVPSGAAGTADTSVLVHNVGTAVAAYEAVTFGIPLIGRVVCVTGEGVNKPSNFLARIGTPISALIEKAGGMKDNASRVILGGPMMGLSMDDLSMPVTKGTSGVLVLEKREVPASGPCINCGRCVRACPAGLIPALLSRVVESGKPELATENNVMDCIECGCCSYVCPARRPMVQHMKLGKLHAAKQKAKQ